MAANTAQRHRRDTIDGEETGHEEPVQRVSASLEVDSEEAALSSARDAHGFQRNHGKTTREGVRRSTTKG